MIAILHDIKASDPDGLPRHGLCSIYQLGRKVGFVDTTKLTLIFNQDLTSYL
jgi:hypothetical protein